MSLKIEALQRAIKLLDAAGAEYGILFNGDVYGSLEVKLPRSPREGKDGRTLYPKGETRAYYEPYLVGLAVGDEVAVPYGGYDPRTLASNISSYCVRTWGKGAAITRRNDAEAQVEVLLVCDEKENGYGLL